LTVGLGGIGWVSWDIDHYQAENTTSVIGNSSEKTTSFTYSATLIGANNVHVGNISQQFSSSTTVRQVTFGDTSFAIPGDSVKWAVNLNVSTPLSSGLSLTYVLADILSGSPTSELSVDLGTITTYYLPLSSSLGGGAVAVLQVLDQALADGAYVTVNHSVIASNSSLSGSTTYELVLSFPPINQWLEYDPVVGLNTLINPYKSGSSDVGLILAISIGGSVALAFILVALLMSLVIARRVRQRRHSFFNQAL